MVKGPGLVQIAGIANRTEANAALDAGADLLGFPLRLPVHAEDLSEEEAAAIIAGLPEDVSVLITYLDKADAIRAFCRDLGVDTVQVHGDIGTDELAHLKPGLRVFKSLVVHPGDDPKTLEAEMRRCAPYVDAFITDTFDPGTGASGATGRTHDWEISRRLAKLSPVPLILAGGLTPDNVYRAILEVRPAGIDSHTGVEDARGHKDTGKMKRFVAEARRAFETIAARASTNVTKA